MGVAISFLEESDEEVMYDLKQLISQSSISTLNPELARHQAAQQRITKEMKASGVRYYLPLWLLTSI